MSLSASVVSYVHLQRVYEFDYVFSSSNNVLQTAVIFGVVSLVAKALVHAPVVLTRLRFQG